MAAAMTGATLGIGASPFSGALGGPPRTGQFFIAIDPAASSGGQFAARIAALSRAFHEQNGAHLPGDGRAARRRVSQREGVAVNVATLERIERIIAG